MLTLSATPIPRTLNMALSGIRDMSTIEEPPMDRLAGADLCAGARLVRCWRTPSAGRSSRGGQVYYLHNRVETIEQHRRPHPRNCLGDEVTVAVGHGKMSRGGAGPASWSAWWRARCRCWCAPPSSRPASTSPTSTPSSSRTRTRWAWPSSTSSGAGWAASNRRAYAYLTYRRGKVLSEVADKRLSAIREFAEFGSGFKIAMRDLEIRGAGNLLGPEQSGFLMSVGYDLYLKLLEEAVLEERGEKGRSASQRCAADLSRQRQHPRALRLLRRSSGWTSTAALPAIRTEEDADDVVDELVDRYGDPPRAVNNLVSIALLRSQAALCGFTDISQKGLVLTFSMKEFELQKIAALSGVARFKGRILFSPGKDSSALSLRLKPGEDVLAAGRRLVETYRQLLEQKQEA